MWGTPRCWLCVRKGVNKISAERYSKRMYKKPTMAVIIKVGGNGVDRDRVRARLVNVSFYNVLFLKQCNKIFFFNWK